ncbi:MAG: transcription termination/antitermination NusG family protein [Bryobacteraceae bacterium]
MHNDAKWYALRVRSRCEKLTGKHLVNTGYQVCTACAPQRRVWADRIRCVEMPVFPGYIFARFDPAQGPNVLRAPGIVSIVGFGTSYHPVEDAEIDALNIVLRSGIEVRREPTVHPGTRVRVRYGPLRGLEGVLVQFKTQHRLVVSVTLLQRSVAVEIDDLMIEAASPWPATRASGSAS